MPNYGFDPGLGPDSLKYMPTRTVFTPADTDASTKVVLANAPLKWAREGTSGYGERAALCLVNEVPELIAIERCELPSYPIGVITVPHPDPAAGETQHFVIELPISGAVPSGDEIGVVADGAGKYKLVTPTMGTLNTGVVGSNNALTWSAEQPGVGGNAITIAIVNDGASKPLTVTVAGKAITVHAATDGSSVITSTAAQVINAIHENGEAADLVGVGNTSTSTGAGVVAAVAATPLATGLAGVGRYLRTTDTGYALIEF
jgi:hypothetical protein